MDRLQRGESIEHRTKRRDVFFETPVRRAGAGDAGSREVLETAVRPGRTDAHVSKNLKLVRRGGKASAVEWCADADIARRSNGHPRDGRCRPIRRRVEVHQSSLRGIGPVLSCAYGHPAAADAKIRGGKASAAEA